MVTSLSLDEALLLADALEVAPSSVLFHSREPMGSGSVTGFHVGAAEPQLFYVDTSALPLPVGDDGAGTATRIWQHPSDPYLPALAPVAFGHAAQTLLARLGLDATGVPEFIAYRPGRRAVVRVQCASGPVWMKVVRPSRVERILRAHEAARDAGIPVPEVHGWSATGLIVMADAHGSPVADAEWAPASLLDEVDALRARFADVDWRTPARGVARRLDWYAARGAGATARLADEARALLARAGERPRSRVVVHGDLHFGQLFVGGHGGISAVIDIDTLGAADPAEDAAAFMSHAVTSAVITAAANRGRVWQLADHAAQRWGADPGVRALTLVHLLGQVVSATDRGAQGDAEAILAAADAILRGAPPSDSDGHGPRSSADKPKDPLTEIFDSP